MRYIICYNRICRRKCLRGRKSPLTTYGYVYSFGKVNIWGKFREHTRGKKCKKKRGPRVSSRRTSQKINSLKASLPSFVFERDFQKRRLLSPSLVAFPLSRGNSGCTLYILGDGYFRCRSLLTRAHFLRGFCWHSNFWLEIFQFVFLFPPSQSYFSAVFRLYMRTVMNYFGKREV